MSIKWLRKFDPVKGKWTNRIEACNAELAKDPNWRLVDNAEAAKCRAAYAIERRQMVAANRKRYEMAADAIIPIINQQAVPEVADPATTEPEPEPEAAPVADDLDAKTKVELQNLIDAEELPVKKIGNKPELIYVIRAARAAKLAKPAAPVAPAVEGAVQQG